MQLIRWRRKFNFRAFANTVIKEIWGEIRPSHFSAYILLLNEASSCHMRTDESWAVTRSYTLKCGSCKRNLHATVQTLQWYSCWWSRNLAFFRLNSVNRRAHVFLLERYLKKKKRIQLVERICSCHAFVAMTNVRETRHEVHRVRMLSVWRSMMSQLRIGALRGIACCVYNLYTMVGNNERANSQL